MGVSSGHKYKSVKRPGITAIIIHNKKVLLLKRRNIPIITNPGTWTFLSGGRDGKEKYLKTAYREIKEEVKLKKEQLKLLHSTQAMLKDEKKGIIWPNKIFIFRSNTYKIKLDLENTAYRWAVFNDIRKERKYTNIFINKQVILNRVRGFLNES